MKNMQSEKKEIRRQIAEEKKAFLRNAPKDISESLWKQIEDLPVFKASRTILLYHSLPDEVETHCVIEKWSRTKKIVLPVVVGDELELREYKDTQSLQRGSFGILEPQGETINKKEIDLAIVPGVAFDSRGHRLGRGKGFYDRLFSHITPYKIGVCFAFQVRDELPSDSFDIRMDEVWNEKGKVCGNIRNQ